MEPSLIRLDSTGASSSIYTGGTLFDYSFSAMFPLSWPRYDDIGVGESLYVGLSVERRYVRGSRCLEWRRRVKLLCLLLALPRPYATDCSPVRVFDLALKLVVSAGTEGHGGLLPGAGAVGGVSAFPVGQGYTRSCWDGTGVVGFTGGGTRRGRAVK